MSLKKKVARDLTRNHVANTRAQAVYDVENVLRMAHYKRLADPKYNRLYEKAVGPVSKQQTIFDEGVKKAGKAAERFLLGKSHTKLAFAGGVALGVVGTVAAIGGVVFWTARKYPDIKEKVDGFIWSTTEEAEAHSVYHELTVGFSFRSENEAMKGWLRLGDIVNEKGFVTLEDAKRTSMMDEKYIMDYDSHRGWDADALGEGQIIPDRSYGWNLVLPLPQPLS